MRVSVEVWPAVVDKFGCVLPLDTDKVSVWSVSVAFVVASNVLVSLDGVVA